MKQLVWPPTDAAAEFDSLTAHIQYYQQTVQAIEPTQEQIELMHYDMEKEFESVRTCIDGCFTYDKFREVLRSLNFQGTPGYPYCRENGTIGEWLGFDGVYFDENRVSQLWYDVNKLINGDFSEAYWRTFIKHEAHKQKKADLKRWRIIMCCGLAVQVLWQMLFSDMNRKEIDQSLELPSQQGIMLCGGVWKLYYKQWVESGLIYGTDNTAWDWTVPGWMLRADLEFRTRLSFGHEIEKWKTVAASLYEDAFHRAKIYLSDGRVYQQQHWGIQKSGCVNTISTNSHGGAMLHCLYARHFGLPLKPFARTVGDDKLQTFDFVKHPEFYEQYGFIIKEVTDDCEFIGHKFTPEGPRPLYCGKHLYNLQYAEDAYVKEILDSFLRLYVNDNNMYKFWREMAQILGLAHAMRSDQYYRFWYHNPLSLDGFKINFDRIGLDYSSHGLLAN